jgi:serine/threonine-protein kinase
MKGQIIGNYEISEKIGEGGMGEVFLGKDLLLERDVAIKSLRPDLSQRQDIVERFRTEAVALARLNHSNIATLYNYIIHNSQYYMILEYVRGERLDSMIARRNSIPFLEILSIIGQVLEGLEHAHRLGIVHRDIKSANIMITPSGRVKIMDFGIARILQNARLTRTGQLVGTLEYMSPEQIKGLETDARTDVYSTGIVAYELLTGRLPFQRNTDYEIIRAQIEEQPVNIRELRTDVPDAVAEVVTKALEKDPEKRYPSAIDFLKAVEKAARTISGDADMSSAPETRIADSGLVYGMNPSPAKATPETLEHSDGKGMAGPGRSSLTGSRIFAIASSIAALIVCATLFMKLQHMNHPPESNPDSVAIQETPKPEVTSPAGASGTNAPGSLDKSTGIGTVVTGPSEKGPSGNGNSSEHSRSPSGILGGTRKTETAEVEKPESADTHQDKMASPNEKKKQSRRKTSEVRKEEKGKESEKAATVSGKTVGPAVTESTETTLPEESIETKKTSVSNGHYAAAHAAQFTFKLNKVTAGANSLTFVVKVINDAPYGQYIAFYDQQSSYERSLVALDGGKSSEADKIYIIQNGTKMPALDAYHGLKVEAGESIIVELTFKDTGKGGWKSLKLHPYSAVKYVGLYKNWKNSVVTIRNQ